MRQELQQDGIGAARDVDAGGSLFPPVVRRVMLGVVAFLSLAGVYLIAVRGPAILFDLAGGIASLCF